MDTNDFPIPVARLIVQNDENEVLILQRAGSAHADGSWCLPGGKIDYGDTVEKSAARELKEETSLDFDSLQFLFYQDSLPLKPGGMHCINRDYDIAFRNDEALIQYWEQKGI
jgi:8-oxo-dGTP pyrophosphatase MutT (NUDIX family)